MMTRAKKPVYVYVVDYDFYNPAGVFRHHRISGVYATHSAAHAAADSMESCDGLYRNVQVAEKELVK